MSGPAGGGGDAATRADAPGPGGGDEARWLARARQARVARLGTRNAAGGVDLVPFVFATLDGPGPLGRLVSAVDHKPKRHGRLQRLANIAAHPEVTVLVDHYEDDWDRLWWVRLRGTAREATSAEERDLALDALCRKYEAYRATRPGGAVLVVELTDVRGWSASPEA